MISLLLGISAALGTYLLVSPSRGVTSPAQIRAGASRLRRRADSRLVQAGLVDVSIGQFVAASVLVGLVATALATSVFGVGLPALLIGGASACAPSAGWRRRRARRRRAAQDSWPALIEELRVLTGAVGRSIPQALIEIGLRGPEEMRGAFHAAQREWALTTDVERMMTVLKRELDDPTADATCETLLIASEVGGDLDRRLAALAEDRREDLRERKEAAAKQAGARLARNFVVLVPGGMALAGLNVGEGRAAYDTAQGQLLVAIGLGVVVGCWWWASRIMALPEPRRVFDR